MVRDLYSRLSSELIVFSQMRSDPPFFENKAKKFSLDRVLVWMFYNLPISRPEVCGLVTLRLAVKQMCRPAKVQPLFCTPDVVQRTSR